MPLSLTCLRTFFAFGFSHIRTFFAFGFSHLRTFFAFGFSPKRTLTHEVKLRGTGPFSHCNPCLLLCEHSRLLCTDDSSLRLTERDRRFGAPLLTGLSFLGPCLYFTGKLHKGSALLKTSHLRLPMRLHEGFPYEEKSTGPGLQCATLSQVKETRFYKSKKKSI